LVIRQHGHHQGNILQCLNKPPFTRVRGNDLCRASFGGPELQLTRNGLAVVVIVQMRINNMPALTTQVRHEMAHRGQNHDGLLRMMTNRTPVTSAITTTSRDGSAKRRAAISCES
jgi:hypothetical protein